jgi:hypothetical protein
MKSVKFVSLLLASCLGWVECAHAQYTGGVMVQDQEASADIMATRSSIIDNGATAHADSLAEKATLMGAPAAVGTAPAGSLQSMGAFACDAAIAAGGVVAQLAPALATCQEAYASGELGIESANDDTLAGDQAAAVLERDAAAARVSSATSEYEATEAAAATAAAATDAQLVANNAQAEERRRERTKTALQTAGKVAVLLMLADMIAQ